MTTPTFGNPPPTDTELLAIATRCVRKGWELGGDELERLVEMAKAAGTVKGESYG